MRAALALFVGIVLVPGVALSQSRGGHLDTDHLPAHLRDRGPGLPLSMFGTYIEKGQLVIYPFFEYYRDRNFEYSPNEFGFDLDRDFRGRYEATEELLFIGYGVSERLAVELEAAIIQAELETSGADPTGIAGEISESGLGDVEGQLRWRWLAESPARPELFSYFEIVVPTQDEGSLIGTTDWEFKLGSGLTRGFGFATVTVRGAVEYDRAEETFEIGELALEALRRLSPSWRVYAGVEGTQDEIELITEAQWHLAPAAFIKLNNSFGLTSKATDWAPEVGVVLTF